LLFLEFFDSEPTNLNLTVIQQLEVIGKGELIVQEAKDSLQPLFAINQREPHLSSTIECLRANEPM
jgi:hypothetical protein